MNELKLIYFSDVKDGKLQKNVAKKIAEELSVFNGQRIEITFSRKKKNRSVQQNRYFHACIKICADSLGYGTDEMKEIVKFKFCKQEIVDEKTGEVMEYIGNTSKMTTIEFSSMMDSFIRWSAEHLNIILPLPNEQFEL